MFDSIGGLPLHPLVIHVVVAGAPLAALLGILFAIPRFRNWSRWALALVAIGTFAASLVAKESGEALQRSLGITPADGEAGQLIAKHSMLADQLVWVLLGYAVVAVLSALVVTRAGRAGAVRAVDRILPILLVVGAVLVLVWCYRTGDAGARAVWSGTGA